MRYKRGDAFRMHVRVHNYCQRHPRLSIRTRRQRRNKSRSEAQATADQSLVHGCYHLRLVALDPRSIHSSEEWNFVNAIKNRHRSR